MASTGEDSQAQEEQQVVFKDLEPFLQKSYGNKNLRVVDYSATSLLPLGENYGSIMTKLNVTIRENEKEAEEEKKLHLVAKMSVRTQRPIISWLEVLKKEVFMYTDIMPAYREIERELGVEESELLDVVPKYIGHRYSLSDDGPYNEECSTLVMENIKVKGYYNCNRRVGIDVEHARKALLSLGKYHALGIALKRIRPEFFEAVRLKAELTGLDLEQLAEAYDDLFTIFRDNQCFAKHLPLIESAFKNMRDVKHFKSHGTEPWVSITHGDFWVNNVLFHKDAKAKVDDVKFVDYQLYLHNSPMLDLPYFLCGSLDQHTLNNHFDELLDLYYDTFMQTLERMGCDSTPFTKDSFYKELKIQAINQFPLCALAIKFFLFELGEKQSDSKQILTTILQSQCSEAYKNKILNVIALYERRGWF